MMPASKIEPILTDPPIEQWDSFHLPSNGQIQKVQGISMPNLRELYCESCSIQTLPWDDLKHVIALIADGCAFQSVPVWRLTDLEYVTFGNNSQLVSVDAHDMLAFNSLDLYYCSSVSQVDVSGCPNLQFVTAYGCALPQSMVDQLLIDLVANGAHDGYLDLTGGTNAAPSNPNGITLKNTLISRGWTISTK